MRVRPGAPQRLELMPGHPFACDARGAAAAGDGKGVAGREPSDEEVVHSTPLEGAQPPAAPDKEQRAGGGGEAGPDGRCTAVFTSGDALPAFQVRTSPKSGGPQASAVRSYASQRRALRHPAPDVRPACQFASSAPAWWSTHSAARPS